MLNSFYSDSIKSFEEKSINEIIGELSLSNKFDINSNSIDAWKQQIIILKHELKEFDGDIHFEFSIPRMGKRVDCLIIIKNVIFVLEFKVGEKNYLNHNIDQVWDYALDLKNFHQPSHNAVIIPILVATEAQNCVLDIILSSHKDDLTYPLKINKSFISLAIKNALIFFSGDLINGEQFIRGSYSPTPTIIEAAVNLYNEHSVSEITRNDAEAINLTKTTDSISSTIEYAKSNSKKVICFVTGVPGAGKTLVGLKIATTHLNKEKGNTSVFLSGNGPLVAVLQEALVRNKVERERKNGKRITKSSARDSVKAFIQIIHHYRDAYLTDPRAPYDHVAIFDEAQRAWNKAKTVDFMRRKKNQPNFQFSEPEYLISCLDRHQDWAVIVCLVGGGQEINTGEGGISEWLNAINYTFPHWEVNVSPNLIDKEYNALETIKKIQNKCVTNFHPDLHLSVSMRSYRAENVSLFVKQLLDLEIENASKTYLQIKSNYPLVLTRNLTKAKSWLRDKARGTERYGIVVSSQAQRLRPLAIDIRSEINVVNWFLEGKSDVRSSYYLEDVATEFQIQGLELDWACVTWDADFRFSNNKWETFSFIGTKWQNILKLERKMYLLNAYRVLLTRARQGMVIVIPEGNIGDPSRNPEYYNPTYEYLKSIGIEEI